MITLNILRCVSPTLDYFVSLLGSLEMFNLYHHFIIMDDVVSVDKNGVPLTADGKIATILEYSNTLPEFWEEARVHSLGSWIMFPISACKLLLRKAKCHRVALADYGDMPHIFRVEEKLSDEDRSRIVSDAEKLLIDHPRYNILLANCDHTTNMVSGKRQFTSPEVHFMLWNVMRYSLTLIGLVLLHVLLVGCYKKACIEHPMWALCAYYTFTAVPVMLQSLISYGRMAWTLRCNYIENMLSRDDLYHLLLKELFRVIVVGGFAVCVMTLMPFILRQSGGTLYTISMSFVMVFAYMGSDIVFSLLAQLSVRLLLRCFGRFWLHGGSPLTREEEQKLKANSAAKKKSDGDVNLLFVNLENTNMTSVRPFCIAGTHLCSCWLTYFAQSAVASARG